MYFFFSLKKSQQMNPLQVPQQGPYGERYPFTGHFCISLETLIKIPLNKNFFFSFLKGPKKRAPLHVPKSGALWKQTPIFRALLNVSFGVPSKRALHSGPLHESLRREMPRS